MILNGLGTEAVPITLPWPIFSTRNVFVTLLPIGTGSNLSVAGVTRRIALVMTTAGRVGSGEKVAASVAPGTRYEQKRSKPLMSTNTVEHTPRRARRHLPQAARKGDFTKVFVDRSRRLVNAVRGRARRFFVAQASQPAVSRASGRPVIPIGANAI